MPFLTLTYGDPDGLMLAEKEQQDCFSIIAWALTSHRFLRLHSLYVLGSRQCAELFCDAFSDLLDYRQHDVRDFFIL